MTRLTPEAARRRLALAGRQMADAVTLYDPESADLIREQFDRALERRDDLADAVVVLGDADAFHLFSAAVRDAWDPGRPRLIPVRPGAPAVGEMREPRRRLPVDVRESLLADVDAVAGFLGLSRQALVEQALHAEVHRVRLCPICDTGSPAIEWARAGWCPECREG